MGACVITKQPTDSNPAENDDSNDDVEEYDNDDDSNVEGEDDDQAEGNVDGEDDADTITPPELPSPALNQLFD